MVDDTVSAPEARTVAVGSSNDLAERGRLIVDVGYDLTIGIFRVNGRLFAYRNRCWHRGGPVCQGVLINRVIERLDDNQRSLGDSFSEDRVHIVCPWHGYEFDVETGTHPADVHVKLEPVPVHEDDGTIYLAVRNGTATAEPMA